MTSFVVVTHNAERTIGECLASLRAAAGDLSHEILVVDTSSRDGTVAAVAAAAPTTAVLRVANRGFAYAANRGAAAVRGNYLFFVNPDAFLPAGALARLLRAFDDGGVSAVSGLLLGPRGEPEAIGEPFPSLRWYIRRRIPRFKHRPALPAAPHRVPWLSGAALLVRADAFRAVGGFSEEYFLYFEDIDLAQKLRARGGELVVDLSVPIRHVGGAVGHRPARLAASDLSEDRYFARFRPPWEGRVLKVLRFVFRRPSLLWIPPGVGAAAVASPAVLLVVAVGVALVAASARAPGLGAAVLLATLLPGQLLRVPLGAVSPTLTDLALPLVLGGWLVALARRPRRLPRRWVVRVTMVIAGAILPGLLLAAERLSVRELLLTLGYAGRFLLLAGLGLLGAGVLRSPGRLALWVVVTAVLLSLTGLLQLAVLPSLADLPATTLGRALASAGLADLTGWDPHVGRLVGTWLDPNLLSALFAVAIGVLLALPAEVRPRARAAALAAGGLLLFALLATRSRAGILALLAASAVLLLQSLVQRRTMPWRRLFSLAAGGALGLLLVPALAPRLLALSADDPTVRLRIASWGEAAAQFSRAPLFGIGYNAYAFEQRAVGNLPDLSLHSRAGADSSSLTFLATTGVFGTALLVGGLLALSRALLLRRRTMGSRAWPAHAALLTLVALLAHAQVIHSLAYVHLATPFALLLAAGFAVPADRGETARKESA